MNRNRAFAIIVVVVALASAVLIAVPLMAGGVCPWTANGSGSGTACDQCGNQISCPALNEAVDPVLDCCGN